MPSKIALQSQSGVIQNMGKVLAKRPVSWKLLGNALNLGIAKQIREQSPQTFLVIRTGSNWAVDDPNFIQRYADEASTLAGPFLNAGLCDILEPPNEPVVQTVELAKLLNDRQVQYAQIMKARGFRVGAYNFSVGNPDYPLWPFLQDGIRASDYWLLLHEYGAPFMDSDPVNLALRHRKVLTLLAPDVRAKVRIGITESGIDLGSIGSAGGYRRMPKPPNDRRIIDVFLEQLTWYDNELAKDPYVKFVNLFGYGMQEPWVGLGFDLAEVEEEREAFISWLSSGVVEQGGSNPPPVVLPPVEDVMRTAGQRVAAAWHSLGVDFNPDAALMLKAKALGLGYPLANEDRDRIPGEPVIALQAFGPEGVTLETEEGKWAPDDIKAYAITTGAPWVRPAPVVVGPPAGVALPYRFPIALSNIGALGEEGSPVAGAPFYRLSGAAVRRGVSAFMVVTVIGKNGAPVIGAKVLNLFPDGNGEIIQTDGSGTARFQFGASSAFTNPGTGPFTIFVADDSAFKDSDATPKRIVWKHRLSDIVKSLGDFQGQHTEINIQMVEQP